MAEIKLKSPIHWLGGKGKMVGKLLDFFPPHHTYVEAFGGGGSMLFAKQPSPVEVYNDLDSGLVNFFRVLRDPEKFPEFVRLVQLTPYAREEYHDFLEKWEKEPDDIKRAHMWYFIARTSFGGKFGAAWGTAVGSSNRGMASTTASWLSTIELLPELHGRLMRVQVENRSYEILLDKYDSPDTLFYLDPPYAPETRIAGEYAHEMSYEDHEKLANRLLTIEGMVLLSGYNSKAYQPLIDAGWVRKEFEVMCSVVGRTANNGLKGVGVASADARQKRIECLWCSPNAMERLRDNLILGMEYA